ncbi:hypothetical protein [Paenibacillus alba]|uniref:Uncharacterized protein n=1 Tax=Paenibacillus alba TaxID=1197127 RepID=A0ABU6GAB2_9BACL|nr:hypothetical protein [Paenibacillus alba]MEC0231086.1 hypothetical protein [Paenibacillus alba]
MNTHVEQALLATLANWKAMTAYQSDEQEAVADQFQSSFYVFIDALREWVLALDPKPRNLDELMAMDTMQEIAERLPGPLLLNFETEAELIMDNELRVDEDSYD